MNKLSLVDARKIAGQLIMIRISGTAMTPELAEYLRANSIRAVCLFRQNMVDAIQLNQLTSDLREVMGDGALIALDEEGGAPDLGTSAAIGDVARREQ
jgi:beta-N-acetylhexosaminidase